MKLVSLLAAFIITFLSATSYAANGANPANKISLQDFLSIKKEVQASIPVLFPQIDGIADPVTRYFIGDCLSTGISAGKSADANLFSHCKTIVSTFWR